MLEIGKIGSMTVYEYTFLDDLEFIRPIEEYLQYLSEAEKERYIGALKTLFLNHGWEGDGELGVIWLPPFIGIGVEDTHGHYIFHVKQNNNGISWLASTEHLLFTRLLEQNGINANSQFDYADSIGENEYIEGNIISADVEWIQEVVTKTEKELLNEYQHTANIRDASLMEQLTEKILGYTQGMLVQYLNDFINDCYLHILIDVLSNGNKSNLKLQKSAVKVDLSRHVNEEDSTSGDYWLTIQMLISDIWRAYMFESFNERLTKLVKAVEYKFDDELKSVFAKHVIIRNCIQHHNWQLEATSLKSIGKEYIEIKEGNGCIRIEKWKLIKLTIEEIRLLCDSIRKFSEGLTAHVNIRVSSRTYRKR